MIRFIPALMLSFMIVFGAAMPARAQAERFEFDKVHTQILFFADHLGFSHSSGRFLDFEGGFTLDEGTPANSSIDVTIKTDSLEMNDQRWNEHLKGSDFFNIATYPTMTFKSTKVDVTGDHTADVTGDLTLLGQTHPVVLHVTHNKTGVHPMTNKKVVGFSATAELDRADWGMTYGTPMMSTKTELRIEVEASPVSEAAEGHVNK